MELIIVKNGQIYARAADDTAVEGDAYELRMTETIPMYPTEKAPKGKEWRLDYVEDALEWILVDRPLTQVERLENVEEEIARQKYVWKAGETVNIGDRRFYDGNWYVCIQAHITQVDWIPAATPALWEMKDVTE